MKRRRRKDKLGRMLSAAEQRFNERFPRSEYPEANWHSRTWNLKPNSRKTRWQVVSFDPGTGIPPLPKKLFDFLRCHLLSRDIGPSHMVTIATSVIALWELLVEHRVGRRGFSLGAITNHRLAEIEPQLVDRGLVESGRYVVMSALRCVIEWGVGEGVLRPNLEVPIQARRPGGGKLLRTRPDHQARQDRLPDLAVVSALGELYRTLTDPRDRLRICAVALLLVGGFRAEELRNLAIDALQSEEGLDGRVGWYILYRNLKSDDESLGQFGKRWLSPLGALLAIEAWEEIRRLTASWRPYAEAVDSHEDRISLQHALGDHEYVRRSDLQRLLGVTSRSGWSHFRRRNNFDLAERRADEVVDGVSPRPGRPEPAYRREEVERWLVGLRGPTQTVSADGEPQRVVDTLLMAPRQFLYLRPGALVFPEPFAPGTIYGFLGDPEHSVFARHGFRDESGRSYSLRPHSLRHFLNTVANKAGMTALQISVWMGRTDWFQTYAYLHDPEEYAEYHREQWFDGKVTGRRAKRIMALPVLQREEAIQDQRVAHMAGDAVCVLRELAACPKHGACHDGCPWATYDKTDQSMRERLVEKRADLDESVEWLKGDISQPDPVTRAQIARTEAQISEIDGVLREFEEVLAQA